MKKLLLALYIAGAIATFGHAWNRDYSNTLDGQATALVAAPVCASLWPLYWSAWFWKGKL